MTDLTVLSEIAPEAAIHPDARIGRWCVIGPNVNIGPRTRLDRRVTVLGHTRIGADNVIGSGSVIGGEPQDLKYRGGSTWLLIGDRNRIGRNVTLNVGTELGGWVTYLGDDNILSDACHVAHDCYVTSGVRLGGKVLLAGHIFIDVGAVVGDMTGVHHFVRIGRYAYVGPRIPVRRDVPPYVRFYSEHAYWGHPMIRGVHEAGMAAAALGERNESLLRKALADLFDDPAAMAGKIDTVENATTDPEVAYVCRFCRECLDGHFGRYRERFRNQIPPEADAYLPDSLLKMIRKESSCR